MKITRYNLPQTFKKGYIPWNKGKPNTWYNPKGLALGHGWNKGKPAPWTSERNKKVNPLMTGKKAYNWKGGTYGTERHRDMARSEYKEWRLKVFTRDKFTCRNPKCKKPKGVYIEAHHIKSWVKYPKLRYRLSNGKTLCLPCHTLTRSYIRTR